MSPIRMYHLLARLFVFNILLSSTNSVSFFPSNHVTFVNIPHGGFSELPSSQMMETLENVEFTEGESIVDSAIEIDNLSQSDNATEVNESCPLQNTSNLDIVSVRGNLGPNSSPPGLIRRKFPNFPYNRIPNWMSLTRCLMIPILIPLFCQGDRHIETATVFALGSFTDWLDGYLARRWDITSPLGALLDTIADKLMVSTALILLAGRYGPNVAISAILIVCREISVTALREWMAQRGVREAVKLKFQGKVKTALTMVSLTLLLSIPSSAVVEGTHKKSLKIGLSLLYLCTVVTLTSGAEYLRAAWPYLMGKAF